jgi:hypothetical protein
MQVPQPCWHIGTGFTNALPLEDFYTNVDLKCNMNLQELIFERFIMYSKYQISSATSWIIRILTELGSQLDDLTITFDLHLNYITELEPSDHPIDWASLDKIGSTASTAVFQINGSVDFRDACFALRMKMPETAKLGKLKCLSDG